MRNEIRAVRSDCRGLPRPAKYEHHHHAGMVPRAMCALLHDARAAKHNDKQYHEQHDDCGSVRN